MKHKTLTHARIDAPHIADGLFVLTQGIEGREVRGHNRIIETRWCDLKITFNCVEPLGDAEQSVLLALVARAGIAGKRISANGQSQRGKALHSLLKTSDRLKDCDGVYVSATIQGIMHDVGLANSGSAYAAIDDALRRLSHVVVDIEDTSAQRRGNTLLLAYEKFGDHVDFALNYRIREALKNTGFTRVDLIERQSLPTPTARLLHTFLSRWLRPGGSQKISLDALAKHVWANALGESKHTRRGRRDTLRDAMREISDLGTWQVEILKDSCIVQRGSANKASNEIRGDRTTRKGATLNEIRGDRHAMATERIAA